MVFIRTREKKHFRGAAAVETAVLLLVLLLLTLGAIKYGWLLLKAQQITNAARHGARLAILPDSTTDGADGVKQAIIDLLDEENIIISPDDIVCTPSLVSDANLGDAVTVEIFVDCNDIDIMDVPLLPKPKQLKASVTMAKEGF
jgi:Flp pilus assembly protein TadG